MRISGYKPNGRYIEEENRKEGTKYSANYHDSKWIENQLIHIFQYETYGTVYDVF